jgi:hypothetical protein
MVIDLPEPDLPKITKSSLYLRTGSTLERDCFPNDFTSPLISITGTFSSFLTGVSMIVASFPF